MLALISTKVPTISVAKPSVPLEHIFPQWLILLTKHIYLKKSEPGTEFALGSCLDLCPKCHWTELPLNRTTTWEKFSLLGCRNYGLCSDRHFFGCEE